MAPLYAEAGSLPEFSRAEVSAYPSSGKTMNFCGQNSRGGWRYPMKYIISYAMNRSLRLEHMSHLLDSHIVTSTKNSAVVADKGGPYLLYCSS